MTTPDPMSHDDIEELLGAYALDAVDPGTAAVVERHLDQCIRCSTEVARHHEVAGLLANSGGAAPAGLWDGIARRLDGGTDGSWDRLAARLDIPVDDGTAPEPNDQTLRGTGGGDVVVPFARSRRRSRPLAAGAGLVAAAAAVIAVSLGVQVNHLHTQVHALQSSPQQAAAERVALSAPGTKKIALSDPTRSGADVTPATIVLTTAGTGFVVNEHGGLPPLASGRTYQLWAVVGSRTISLGLLGTHPGIVPFSVAGSPGVSAFAITDEVAGGVVTTANQPVAAGTVQV